MHVITAHIDIPETYFGSVCFAVLSTAPKKETDEWQQVDLF